MKSTLCLFREGCRYQQAMIQLQRQFRIPADASLAPVLRCRDEKDMDRSCPLFWNRDSPQPLSCADRRPGNA
jgi:hypothetical protein